MYDRDDGDFPQWAHIVHVVICSQSVVFIVVFVVLVFLQCMVQGSMQQMLSLTICCCFFTLHVPDILVHLSYFVFVYVCALHKLLCWLHTNRSRRVFICCHTS